jgi:hypothetical protein
VVTIPCCKSTNHSPILKIVKTYALVALIGIQLKKAPVIFNSIGIIAVSCTKRSSYEERVEMGAFLRPKVSLILIWSFQDPIHPQVFFS